MDELFGEGSPDTKPAIPPQVEDDTLEKRLMRPIPIWAVYDKKGLSYIKGAWVIDRMNQLFGAMNWERRTTRLEVLPMRIRKTRNGEQTFYEAWATVEVSVRDEGGRLTTRSGSSAGNGFGDDDGLRNATGEAETDAFKRAAASLGRALGLELYLPFEVGVDLLRAAAARGDRTLANHGEVVLLRVDERKLRDTQKQRITYARGLCEKAFR